MTLRGSLGSHLRLQPLTPSWLPVTEASQLHVVSGAAAVYRRKVDCRGDHIYIVLGRLFAYTGVI